MRGDVVDGWMDGWMDREKETARAREKERESVVLGITLGTQFHRGVTGRRPVISRHSILLVQSIASD